MLNTKLLHCELLGIASLAQDTLITILICQDACFIGLYGTTVLVCDQNTSSYSNGPSDPTLQ